MAEDELSVPETKVLAIASHVRLVTYGYVGNTIATFVMQSLGCEVSAINTVNYSNHLGYRQATGRKSTAEEIWETYRGLKNSYLDDFNMMLSGYLPSPEAIETVGKIGRELKLRSTTKPGSFFWVMDPVMGDAGRFYVPEDSLPAYKSLLQNCDLILPNQFELEALSGTKITTIGSLVEAITQIHAQFNTPHVFITSTQFQNDTELTGNGPKTITVVGSTRRGDRTPRVFRIDVPYFPVFFSGTGDMFAALLVSRFREAAFKENLLSTPSWLSPDEVPATELPLAKATEKVVASMQAVLNKTYAYYEVEKEKIEESLNAPGHGGGDDEGDDPEKKKRLLMTRAVELRVVRNVKDLVNPPDVGKYPAQDVAS